MTRPELEVLRDDWASHWEEALAAWSRYTRLHAPRFCFDEDEEAREGLTGSFAMIRLADQSVVVSLRQIAEQHLERFPREILAHEIGHHVFCPADLTDHARTIVRIRAGLPTKEHLAGLVSNLYTDLLVNDRLQRSAGLDMAGVYLALGGGEQDRLWTLYMRIYEILWGLGRGRLATGAIDDELEGDAALGARLVRVYAQRFVDGAGGFAALLLPYLLEDEARGARGSLRGFLDTEAAGRGGEPNGLAEIEDDEAEPLHPSLDPEVSGRGGTRPSKKIRRDLRGGRKKVDRYRGPFEYGELLREIGVEVDEAAAAARYYRERAVPHLVRFPQRTLPEASDPLPEGLETWDAGSPLSRADWLESVLRSPLVVPGVTTVQRTYGTTAGGTPERRPVDLYVGIDCSGSMPNPRLAPSYPVLAGTILALSALRAGARVKVVLSGEPGRALSTDGFVSAEGPALSVLTDYLGTGYAFGVHRLAETFDAFGPASRPTHIVVITDQDIISMLEGRADETPWEPKKHGTGPLGWDVARAALAKARGGGTFVLNMPRGWDDASTERMRKEGFAVHRIYDWAELLAFARDFSRRTYGTEAA